MSFNLSDNERLRTSDNRIVDAVKPVVISASRATDIPAFYGQWMRNRLRDGYCVRLNPFNRKSHSISFAGARVFVFWTKNPAPFLSVLPDFDARGLNYYFQFTLNDYEAENLEPHVPPLAKRIDTFHELAEAIGAEKVIWRFDPLMLADDLTIDLLMEKVFRVGRMLEGRTRKMVFSFADIDTYRKVAVNLRGQGVRWRNFSAEEMTSVAIALKAMGSSLGMAVAACAEEADLSAFGIEKNRCIDDRLMRTLFSKDGRLMDFLDGKSGQGTLFPAPEDCRSRLKDRGQRKACGCIVSRDIGSYDTCPHLCRYCYANGSSEKVKGNVRERIDPESESLLEI